MSEQVSESVCVCVCVGVSLSVFLWLSLSLSLSRSPCVRSMCVSLVMFLLRRPYQLCLNTQTRHTRAVQSSRHRRMEKAAIDWRDKQELPEVRIN